MLKLLPVKTKCRKVECFIESAIYSFLIGLQFMLHSKKLSLASPILTLSIKAKRLGKVDLDLVYKSWLPLA